MGSNVEIESVIQIFAQLGASWVLWCLAALSLIVTGLIVERGVCYWTTREDVAGLERQVGELIASGQIERLQRILAASPSHAARIAASGLECRTPEAAAQRMLGTLETARLELESNLTLIGTVGNNAPFVGLLGTVIGVVGAFQQMESSAGALSDGLMAAVGEALVATALGLLVALPAVGAFNLFRRVAEQRCAQAEALRRAVIGHLQERSAPTGGV